LAGSIVLGALGMLPLAGQAGAAQPAATKATVTGTWKIRTTDCVFGCNITVTVVQKGHVLTSPTDPELHGTISGKVMVLARLMATSKVWGCEGDVKKADTKWGGSFASVSGSTITTGTFTATKT
jgi:hypothetical protein